MAISDDSIDDLEEDENFPSLSVARSAYGDMLHDTERNVLYERGIEWAIREMRSRGVENVVVLDIGTGSGLLSMLAARHGADTLYACDEFVPVVEVARKVINLNGFENKVKIIPKTSYDVTVGPGLDMESKAHILVAELFDTELIGEGALRAYADAKSRLLVDDCIMVPQDATVFVQLVDSPFLRSHHRIAEQKGIKLTTEIENCHGTAGLHDLQLTQLEPEIDIQLLTEPIEAFHFNFCNVSSTPISNSIELPSQIPKCDPCVLMWWTCTMCPDVVLSCAPHWAHPDGRKQAWRDHWMQAIYYPFNRDGKFLSCCRDEFSFWFDLRNSASEVAEAPVCTCGVHFTVPRSRIAQLSDWSYIEQLKEALNTINSVNILYVAEGALTLPLALANQMPEKNFFVFDTGSKSRDVTKSLVKKNGYSNCTMFTGREDRIDVIFGEPFFFNEWYPWDHWFHFKKTVQLLQSKYPVLEGLQYFPNNMKIMQMFVDLKNLWKIRSPIVSTVGFDMDAYDNFIQSAIRSSDLDAEPQPMWEYPCTAKTLPEKLAQNPVKDQTVCIRRKAPSNGIVLWSEFEFNDKLISTGPCGPISVDGKPIIWNRLLKQSVIIDSTSMKDFSFRL